jgi:hypothetical protein
MVKRALLVGINEYSNRPLSGCVNDVHDMRSFLRDTCGLAEDRILRLTDSSATRDNILERLGWLIEDSAPGDALLFYCSAHGTQLRSLDPAAELDGLDEVFCAYGFDGADAAGLRDKELARRFAAIPDGVRFVWISDCCFSGGMSRDGALTRGPVRSFPLPPDILEDNRLARRTGFRPAGMFLTAHVNKHVFIGACREGGSSYEDVFRGRVNGAFTHYLLEELRRPGGLDAPLPAVLRAVSEQLLREDRGQEPVLILPQGTAARGLFG